MKNKIAYLNNFLKYGIFLCGVLLLILHFVPGPSAYFTKVWSYVATAALPFVPDFLRLFGLKISRKLEFWYYMFIIPAMILGIDLDFYKWRWFPFDKVVHLASGCLAAFVGREIIEQASGKPDLLWFKALFCVCFVCFTAVLWECFEFACDQLFKQSMQQLISVGVADTMWDMISALIGGVVATTFAYPVKVRTGRKN